MPEFKVIIENNGNLIDNKNDDSSVNDSEPHFTYDPDMSNEEWEAMLKAALENYKKKKMLNNVSKDITQKRKRTKY